MLSQPAVAPAAGRASRTTLRDWVYGADPEGADAPGDLPRCRGGRRRRRAAAAGARPSSTASSIAPTSSSRASPAPSTSSTSTAAGGAGCELARPRRRGARPEEARHLPDRARRARAGAAAPRARELGTAAAAARAGRAAAASTPALARDLIDALHFLMALKLDDQLRQKPAGQRAGQPGAAVRARHAGARRAASDALAHRARAFAAMLQRALPARCLVRPGEHACPKA